MSHPVTDVIVGTGLAVAFTYGFVDVLSGFGATRLLLRRALRRSPPHLRGRTPAEGTEAPPGMAPMNPMLLDVTPSPVEPRTGTPGEEWVEVAGGRCARMKEGSVPAAPCSPTAIAEGRPCVIREGRDW